MYTLVAIRQPEFYTNMWIGYGHGLHYPLQGMNARVNCTSIVAEILINVDKAIKGCEL